MPVLGSSGFGKLLNLLVKTCVAEAEAWRPECVTLLKSTDWGPCTSRALQASIASSGSQGVRLFYGLVERVASAALGYGSANPPAPWFKELPLWCNDDDDICFWANNSV